MNRTHNSGDETSRTWRLLTMSHRRNLVPILSPPPPIKRAAKAVLRRGLYALLLVGILAAGLMGYALTAPEMASAQGSVPPARQELTLHPFNGSPQGIWSDGSTMWVARGQIYSTGSYEDFEVYAYDLRYGEHQPSRYLSLPTIGKNVNIGGRPAVVRTFPHYGNAGGRPTGIWSDGSTMWVAVSKSFEIVGTIRDKEYPSDFFGAETRKSQEAYLIAYNLSTRARDPGRDFTLVQRDPLLADYNANPNDPALNDSPQGIWSDGSTMYVVDNFDKKVYAYSMSTRGRVPSKDFDLDLDLDLAILLDAEEYRGIWSDGSTIWVGELFSGTMYAYDLASKRRVPSRDFTPDIPDQSLAFVSSFWSDGSNLWLTNIRDRKLNSYAALAISDVTVSNVTPHSALATVSASGFVELSGQTIHLRYRTAADGGRAPGEWVATAPATLAEAQCPGFLGRAVAGHPL